MNGADVVAEQPSGEWSPRMEQVKAIAKELSLDRELDSAEEFIFAVLPTMEALVDDHRGFLNCRAGAF